MPKLDVFFNDAKPLIQLANKRELESADVPPNPPDYDNLLVSGNRFENAFLVPEKVTKEKSAGEKEGGTKAMQSGRDSPALAASDTLIKAVILSFKARFLSILGLNILVAFGDLLRPIALQFMLSLFQGGTLATGTSASTGTSIFANLKILEVTASQGLLVFCVLMIATTFLRQHSLGMSFKLTWAIPGLLRAKVYEKLLAISPQDRSEFTTGELVNLSTRDCDQSSFLPFCISLLVFPLSAIALICLLVSLLGPLSLFGVLLLGCVVPLSRKLEKRSSHLGSQIREQAKIRLGVLSEMLTGIRVIKYYGWERNFVGRVLQVRNKEVALLQQRARLSSWSGFISSLLPLMVFAVMISVIAVVEGTPQMADVFPAMFIMNSLGWIFSEVPELIQAFAESKVSFRKLESFLALPNSHSRLQGGPDSVAVAGAAGAPQQACVPGEIRLNNASAMFASAHDKKALSNITLHIAAAEKVAVVGSIGSGKSTLLSALVNEQIWSGGTHEVIGPVSYHPQTPWNLNATIKDNVTFVGNFDAQLYEDVLNACNLRTDLAELPAGDETEIGERGINLSGGQKQRLSLARTLYCALQLNHPIVILDDPFSALDEEVAKGIFERTMYNLLRFKTVVYTTHNIDFALQANKIILLKDGRIAESVSSSKINGQISTNKRHPFWRFAHYSPRESKGSHARCDKGGCERTTVTTGTTFAEQARKWKTYREGKDQCFAQGVSLRDLVKLRFSFAAVLGNICRNFCFYCAAGCRRGFERLACTLDRHGF